MIIFPAIDLYEKANGIADDDEMLLLDDLVTFKWLRW